MLLETGSEEVRFCPRPVEGVIGVDNIQPQQLILDGQQRLTSLYRALSSKEPVATKDEKQKPLSRYYYLDIEKCLDPDADRLDAVLSIPSDRQVKIDFGRVVDLDLTSRLKEIQLRLIPVNILLDLPTYFSWRSAYNDYWGTGSKEVLLMQRFEEEVWARLLQFKIPLIQLLKGASKEAVCQVFEQVNTGGVSLTVFELVTATFAADDFRLPKDWEQRKEGLRDHGVLDLIEGTEFLQAVTLLASYKRNRETGSGVSVKRKDVLKLTLEDYKKNAAPVEQGFIKAARLLASNFVFDSENLPYGTQLVPLAAACAYLDNHFEQQAIRDKLSRWYWCGVFGELYGGANESRYALDIQDLCSWTLENGQEPRTVRDANFTPIRLLSLQSRQSAAYKGLMALMIQKGSWDFMSGDSIAHANGFKLAVNIHHVFPRAWCEKQGLRKYVWNSIVNKSPLTAYTNRSLGGSAPSQYLRRLVERGAIDSKQKLDEILETHFINPKLLWEDKFDQFIQDRASRLLDAIETMMGKPVSGRDSEEVVKEFGYPLEVNIV